MLTLLLAAALTASCPTVQPGPGWVCVSGGWLPPGHPGIPAAPAPLPPAPEPPQGDQTPPVCDPRPDPYSDPNLAAACSAWSHEHTPRPALPTFEVGATYKSAYGTYQIVVLAVNLSLEGVPVVSAQYTKPAARRGVVFAFRVTEAQPWIPVD